jgi:hypothetical protein
MFQPFSHLPWQTALGFIGLLFIPSRLRGYLGFCALLPYCFLPGDNFGLAAVPAGKAAVQPQVRIP